MRLCVMHNLYFYNTMMTEIRDALDKGEFAAYKKRNLTACKELCMMEIGYGKETGQGESCRAGFYFINQEEYRK